MVHDDTRKHVETFTDDMPGLARELHVQLQRYIEAQYPIRHASVVAERHALLETPGVISQVPFVESMPGYVKGKLYHELALPTELATALQELSRLVALPAQLYQHQEKALEAFVRDGRDLIVVTGTGSGKTETFLLPILARALEEANKRIASFRLPGMRTLLLYPMNALVNDQLTRLRRLFGNPQLVEWFQKCYHVERPLRFGMYTSRTPYPGVMSAEKNRQQLLPLLHYYLSLQEQQPQQEQELRKLGRWPMLNLEALSHHATLGQTHIGAQDYELYTRQQIQEWCPDLLITNYSMLEYMLMRPIERTLFEQTARWLQQDQANTLLIVLDEAHLYSGVTGAEISLLLRRLQARLGITRERVRYILTSASLDTGDEGQQAILDFANTLVGQPKTAFAVIQGKRLQTPQGRQLQTMTAAQEAQILNNFDLHAFTKRLIAPEDGYEALVALAKHMGWSQPPRTSEAYARYLGHYLPSLRVFQHLWQMTAGQTVSFQQLAHQLFPTLDEQEQGKALSALLVLAATALTEEGITLLPVRAHLFFRGLPPLYACVNPHCSERRVKSVSSELGALWLSSRLHCACGGRVYELFGHRYCGAIFLRAFAQAEPADFYWHEPAALESSGGGRKTETLLLVGQPHPKVQGGECLRLHISTGQVTTIRPDLLHVLDDADDPEYLIVYRPATSASAKKSKRTRKTKQEMEEVESSEEVSRHWKSCPVCRKRLHRTSLTSLSTKGEQPFVNLVRRQFELQPPSQEETDATPNMGRKVLLFSDGRQRAARLARDLPREVELDTFRQALLLAVAQQSQRSGQALVRMDQALYRTFVAVCAQHRLHFFDGKSQQELLSQMRGFRDDYTMDSDLAESDEWEPPLSQGYRLALLRQVADPFYSMQRMCAAVVEPTTASLRILSKKPLFARLQSDELRALAIAWIEALLADGAFDSNIASADRQQLLPREGVVSSSEGQEESWNEAEKAAELLLGYKREELRQLRQLFVDELCETKEKNIFLRPEKLALRLTLGESWHQCRDCSQLLWQPLRGTCSNSRCGSTRLLVLPGDDLSLRARTNFYREPIRQVIEGQRAPTHMTAEEHTAQLSHRDLQQIETTTEQYELRFQNIGVSQEKPTIDVLSCTTTMEVGVDIGSLLGIGLRTMPPRRANYQQRAGRAGRRSAALATVLAYSENGSHDAHYFNHPEEMITGPLPCPHISKVNQRLARRHIQAVLLQSFFLERMNSAGKLSDRQYGYLADALGTARAFFSYSTPHNLNAFEQWVEQMLTTVSPELLREVASWLPDDLAEGRLSPPEKVRYVMEVARDVTKTLHALGEELFPSTGVTKEQGDFTFRADEMMFLDLLFEHGLLPAYAFPREVRSFVIETWKDDSRGNKRIATKQRPEQSVDIALAEYVPGRELIVDKETYRVGGIYIDPFPGATVANRVASFFKREQSRFAFCSRCGYTQREALLTTKSGQCPLCQQKLSVEEILDPPGFAPERGVSLEQSRQRVSNTTPGSAATQVKLVLPLTDSADFGHEMMRGRVAWSYAEHRELLIANRGANNDGFSVCRSCGAAAQGDPPWLHRPHERPFLVPGWAASRQCSGTDGVWHGYLGHLFHSDLLLLRLRWAKGIAYQVEHPWLRDALDTLAQALLLAATRLLDIAPSELQVGWSYTIAASASTSAEPPRMADFFLFDTLSGGAGYATQVGRYVGQLLEMAQEILDTCPEQCERSCYRCLRTYSNRFMHQHLDRHLAATLLRALISGQPPASFSTSEQVAQLDMLQTFLELSRNVTCERAARVEGQTVPLLVKTDYGSYAIGTYPVQQEISMVGHPLDAIKTKPVRLVSDYELAHDLPAVAERLR